MSRGPDACAAIRTQSSRFLDGQLDATARRAVQDHLRACPACLAEFRSTLDLARLARRVPRRAAPDDLAQRVRIEVARRRRDAASRLSTTRTRIDRDLIARRAAAALLAFALAATAFVLGRATAPLAPAPTSEPGTATDASPPTSPPQEAAPPTTPPDAQQPELPQLIDPPLPADPASDRPGRRR